MTLPPIEPEKSTSGISVDPVTLERVVPSSKRPDGTIRKEIKIRPGFTPQEDVGRFRSQRQQIVDARKAGPRVVPGWAPPAQTTKKPPKPKSETATTGKPGAGTQKKTEKAKAKEKAPVKDSWEDEDEDDKDKAKKPDTSSSKLEEDPAKADATGQKNSNADVDLLVKDVAAVTISEP